MRGQIAQEKQSWERRKEQLAKELREEKQWQRDRLEKELEQARWEYELEEKKKNRELQEKEAIFAQQLKEYETLKRESTALPEKIGKEVKKAVQKTESRLQSAFATEKKIMGQEHKAEKELLAQKIETLTARITEYKDEITKLNKQLDQASIQIKQLAVAALQREPSPRPESAKEKE